MDKPARLAGSDDSDFSRPADAASDQNLGATGVFEAVKSPEAQDEQSARGGNGQVQESAPAVERRRPQPASGAETLAEPVVHKVVLGGGVSTDSMQLLSRMRRASDLKAPESKKQPPIEYPGKTGSSASTSTGGKSDAEGFTQLLRSLGVDSAAPGASGGANRSGIASPEQFATAQYPPSSQISEPGKGATEDAEPGEFTKLLRASQYGNTDARGFPKPDDGADNGGAGDFAIARGGPRAGENQPGEFTRLLNSLEGSAAGSSSPATTPPGTKNASRAAAASFTDMLAMEQKSARAEARIFNEPRPAGGERSVNLPIPANNPPAPDLQPFASRGPIDPPPDRSGQQGDSPGITRLIRMLDSPSSAPSQAYEPPPASPVSNAGSGAWTQTFASLDDSTERPGGDAADAPYRPVPQERAGSDRSIIGQGIETPGSLNQRAAPAAALPSASSGPSEYTRIIDASRMRESALRENQAAGHSPSAAPPAPAAPAASPQVQVQMPSYPISALPGMVGMQGGGNLPHMGGVGSGQPLHVPGYPMNIGPQGGSISAMGGSVSVTPGMHVPAMPQPSVPQPPPMKPAPTGLGKLQQYVPLLLILIIFLLVGLLVTVVFLLKH